MELRSRFILGGSRMRKLNDYQLEMINGGGPYELYKEIRDFVNNSLNDLIQGIKDGWNSI